MMTIGESVELIHRAKTRVERAKRVANVHEDIEIIENLVLLAETLQASLRETATVSRSNDSLRATILNIQALAKRGFPIDSAKLETQCRLALDRRPGSADT